MSLTIAIIAKNAAHQITAALDSAKFANQIIVIDDNSTDNTATIAKNYTSQVITAHMDSFADKRNEALKHNTSDWIFYLDTDEIITPELKQELLSVTLSTPGCFKVIRHNYFLGTRMYNDLVDRLFHRDCIKSWQGVVHESPIISTPSQQLTHPLLHYTHTDITSMLAKTNHWSEYEADLRFEAHHPPMANWRLIRMAITTLSSQIFGKKLWSYGRNGCFEAYFQMVDKLVVYTKLWERQQR